MCSCAQQGEKMLRARMTTSKSSRLMSFLVLVVQIRFSMALNECMTVYTSLCYGSRTVTE
eukprot:COSAG05_NODE_1359_length_5097_cov_2.531813_3_plen_60_part_00